MKTISDSTTAFYAKSKKFINNTQHKDSHSGKPKGPRCYNCNKYGHMGKQCWFKNKNKEDNKGSKNSFIAAFSASSVNDASSWYVDSGASAHMTMHRDWLSDVTVPPVSSIRIADNKSLKVECCGNVLIKIIAKDGSTETIQVRGVLFVPELKTNLLSIAKIIKSGYKVTFNKVGCQIYNNNRKLIANANLINDTYQLNVCKKDSMCAMITKTEDNIYLWHQRMGHLNFNDIKKIRDCTEGVKLSSKMQNCICITCLEGKQTSLLELIHSDVCGPMKHVSIGGARYLVTFIDDFSRRVQVYFIKSKAEVLEKFVEFKNRVENELNKRIKIIHILQSKTALVKE